MSAFSPFDEFTPYIPTEQGSTPPAYYMGVPSYGRPGVYGVAQIQALGRNYANALAESATHPGLRGMRDCATYDIGSAQLWMRPAAQPQPQLSSPVAGLAWGG